MDEFAGGRIVRFINAMKLPVIKSLVVLSFSILFCLPSLAENEWFVSPKGNDANPGTREKPFATLEVTRDAVRQFRSTHSTKNATVWLDGGIYTRDRSFELTASDGGSSNAPVIYRSQGNGVPRLVGGRVIKNFKPVADPQVLSRFTESARSHVLVADLKGQGITNYGELQPRGFSRHTFPAHMELFFGGEPMILARYPNEGEWLKISDIPSSGAHKDEHGGELGNLRDGFHFAEDRPAHWQVSKDIWVHGYWAWDWANSYEQVTLLDTARHLVKTAPPHGLYGFRKGQRFCFINVLEELDQPGEYYVDRNSGLLYFWPPKPIDSSEVLVSILESPLVSIKNASNITLRGIAFEATRGTAIQIDGGSEVCIAGCGIHMIGNDGVIVNGGHGHRVVGCNIDNTGDAGVILRGGNRQTLSPGLHVVEDCHFQKQGRWTKCYVPAILMEGVGLRASHNLIHDHPHCGLLFTGNDHLIEFNEIHHIALETGDVGAIYTGRNYTFRGNRICNNFIHHTGGVGMGSMGVYMDDCVSGTEISSNVFYKVSRAAFLGGGRDHHVENNIFVDCQPAVAIDARGMDKAPVWHNMVYDFMKKGLGEVPKDLYRSRYPAITTLDKYYEGDPGIPAEHNVVVHNISVGGKWMSIDWHADSKLQDIHDNFVGSDPGFVAPEKMDFRLKSDASVLKQGFHPIPFDRVGLVDNEFRREPAVR